MVDFSTIALLPMRQTGVDCVFAEPVRKSQKTL
jgi:hypothetical protein